MRLLYVFILLFFVGCSAFPERIVIYRDDQAQLIVSLDGATNALEVQYGALKVAVRYNQETKKFEIGGSSNLTNEEMAEIRKHLEAIALIIANHGR